MKSNGMEPHNLLSLAENASKFARNAIAAGMVPDKRLICNEMRARLLMEAIASGILPDKLLRPKLIKKKSRHGGHCIWKLARQLVSALAAQNRESRIARFPASRARNRQKFRSKKH